LPENVPGDFFVDETCIDCDQCRRIAPEVFARSSASGRSYVHHQPEDAQRRRAAMALVACPTSSIGTEAKLDVREAARAFPEHLEDGVHFCGFTSEKSFGASSYLIVRPEGNVLVDSPRAAGPLLARIAELGGVRWLFLSHRDDVADHAQFHERFGCTRVLHRDDMGPGTRDLERPIVGLDPVELAPDLTVIPVPGHTRGSAALLYKRKFLFTGDHLAWDRDSKRLDAMRSVCWWSPDAQLRSLERLLAYEFEWILPGHGDPWHAPSPAVLRSELAALVAELESEK
jgi:glyoxylase-like metal-dependent hydrolase (beta-lactamase superfamily II)/ferredoxin